ncbi:MAG TPA: isocitrate dehydrogenase (NADP(+)) [Candidatus Sumerlaeota bacterium]|nr:isocitrate dehydrogenase (NADP(+)) [Candidatus Sumerlaeota bacterium]
MTLDMTAFPSDGSLITSRCGALNVPDNPIIPFIEGDGIGPEIMPAAKKVLDRAVQKSFGGGRRLVWHEIPAGEQALHTCACALPDETIETIRLCRVALKGPLTTPVGGGIRSLNVTLRQHLDLYACVRPVRHFEGITAPVRHPEKLDVVIFRENTEDVYAGIEWARASDAALKVIRFLNIEMGIPLSGDAGIGVKPISREASRRLIRRAIQFAVDQKRKSVTLVHKGNIMKFTEGAFRAWGYELAAEEFSHVIITEHELREQHGGVHPEGKILLNDRIADNMFQQLLLKPEQYDVIAAPNLNGDYLSDACAAQVGGLGIAPGANIGDETAVFEATHGAAPDIAGKGLSNPSSLILSGCMLLDHIGWHDAADVARHALQRAFAAGFLTMDLAYGTSGPQPLTTLEFTQAVLENIR